MRERTRGRLAPLVRVRCGRAAPVRPRGHWTTNVVTVVPASEAVRIRSTAVTKRQDYFVSVSPNAVVDIVFRLRKGKSQSVQICANC